MKRRSLAVLLAFGLLPFSAGVTFAHGSAQYDPPYNDYCSNGTTVAQMDAAGDPISRGFNIVRTSSGVGSRIIGSRGKITARALWPCLDGDGTHITKSLVLGGNIQTDPALDGAYNLAQAGIGKVHFASGLDDGCTGADATVDDQTHFMYTPDPVGAPGVMCRAGFVDFNNDGTPDNPVGGVDYWPMVMYFDSGTNNYFRICFERMTDLAIDCKNVNRTARDGGATGNNASWWGFEAGNSVNSWTPSYSSKVVMYQMQYQKKSDGLWYYTENSTRAAPWGPNPSWWACSSDQAGTGESWWCYTNNH